MKRSAIYASCIALLCGAAAAPAEPAAVSGDHARTTAKQVCAKYASPRGSNRGRGRGTRSRPFRTVGRLSRSLRPGQTGCLRRGTYEGEVNLRSGGTRRRRVTIRAHPGERVTLRGRLIVRRTASDLTIRGLRLDGRNPRSLPSPTVCGDRVTFARNDVTNSHTAICFGLGTVEYGRANGTSLVGNRIHHCGRLPATNHDHGIYVEEATDTLILGNWIHHNADRGIQLYPNAQHTRIVRNVIHANGTGVLFSGEGGNASSDTLVEHNVITGATLRYNVESYYPPGNPVGVRNLVRNNCIGGGARDFDDGGVDFPTVGFRLVDNLRAIPDYVDAARGNFRVPRKAACGGLIAVVAAPGP